ncbi:hypothetical protein SEEM5321_06275 [Salmonella enterica subsp. enterica serovar Montevideo str. CT_02035321]|nr:hypothetical protein SEEM315_02588 [Salmonella enterica subsp. enterica serovar Montevideo str. 315996572]EFY17723.1 hypothetical protein SEEM971_16392 [Salmonella enterica subsp. enterica serovar Montevideo str. 495297-1]EFY19886.1 hypothetical protein SEEM973_04896 [Salmonella enterica subsp. enterica serovar Montevideo str. 495297-3]EFY25122.1 hypothetical protein SEEM974_15345 [Salmonella enterica subsp. enterica serovar Montevideo str. 495297-4]EFY31471.1 hypothetical protein SEEM201_17
MCFLNRSFFSELKNDSATALSQQLPQNGMIARLWVAWFKI